MIILVNEAMNQWQTDLLDIQMALIGLNPLQISATISCAYRLNSIKRQCKLSLDSLPATTKKLLLEQLNNLQKIVVQQLQFSLRFLAELIASVQLKQAWLLFRTIEFQSHIYNHYIKQDVPARVKIIIAIERQVYRQLQRIRQSTVSDILLLKHWQILDEVSCLPCNAEILALQQEIASLIINKFIDYYRQSTLQKFRLNGYFYCMTRPLPIKLKLQIYQILGLPRPTQAYSLSRQLLTIDSSSQTVTQPLCYQQVGHCVTDLQQLALAYPFMSQSVSQAVNTLLDALQQHHNQVQASAGNVSLSVAKC